MALPHAGLLDVINVAPLGAALAVVPSTSLLKTTRVQLLHLVLRAREDQPEHRVEDECVIHCIEGGVDVIMPGGTRYLAPAQLVVLPAGEPHALRAREADAAVLVTLLLRGGDAGDGGGANAPR
jgi:quercetin dioxygenase-like cupin family protein